MANVSRGCHRIINPDHAIVPIRMKAKSGQSMATVERVEIAPDNTGRFDAMDAVGS